MLRKMLFLKSRHDFWSSHAQDFTSAQELCVGSWAEQEAYPYTDLLLANYKGEYGKAYDFGCGPGRMMKHMLGRFNQVDGGELVAENIVHARNYLGKGNYQLFKLDGKKADTGERDYDFIYSTIVIHHIAPFSVRHQIFRDFFAMLKPGGHFCVQVVFGIDTGMHWFDNPYSTIKRRNTVDASIPDESHLPAIQQWLEKTGFTNIQFRIEPSPHAAAVPELKWLFIDGDKPGA